MNHVLQYTQLKFKFDHLMKPKILGSMPNGVTTYFLFLFYKRENQVRTKKPLMTLVWKKQYAKTRFWVRGSGYLLGRYLMLGSTPLSPRFGLY